MAEQLPSGRRVPTALPPTVRGVSAHPSGMEPPPDLREWFAVVRRHLRLACGVAAAVFAVAVYLVYTSPDVYRATSVVRLVDARRALAGGLVDRGADGDVTLPSANPVLSQVEVLRSRATAGAVVDDMPILRVRTPRFPVALLQDVRLSPAVERDSLPLRFGPQTVTVQGHTQQREVAYGAAVELDGIRFTLAAPPSHETGTLYVVGRERAISGLTGRLLVRPRENTDVIDIGFTASDPERAQEVANRVARVFQAANARTAQQEARRRREFIETQLRFNDSLRSEEHTSELQSPCNLVCRLLLEKKILITHMPALTFPPILQQLLATYAHDIYM